MTVYVHVVDPLCRCPDILKWYMCFEVVVLEIRTKGKRLENTGTTFSGDRISDDAASTVTGDEPSTMALPEVDDSSD